MKLASQKDFFSGLMFTIVGITFAIGATNFTVGSAARMGPGYFPLLLGIVLAALGVIVTLQSFKSKAIDGDHVRIRCAIQLGNGTHWDVRFSINGKCEALRGIPQLDGKVNDQRYLCPAIEKSTIPTELCAAPAGDWVWMFWLVWHGLFSWFPGCWNGD